MVSIGIFRTGGEALQDHDDTPVAAAPGDSLAGLQRPLAPGLASNLALWCPVAFAPDLPVGFINGLEQPLQARHFVNPVCAFEARAQRLQVASRKEAKRDDSFRVRHAHRTFATTSTVFLWTGLRTIR